MASKVFRLIIFFMGCMGIYTGYVNNSWPDLVAGALVIICVIVSFNE